MLNNLIRIREKRNEPERLIKFLTDLHTANPKNNTILDALISMYIKHRKFDSASDLMRSSKHRVIFNVFQGDIELALGNSEKAKELWYSVANGNTDDHLLLFEVAERFKDINENESAFRLYQQSYASAPSPKELDALYAQAFLYANIGKKDEAIQMWQTIIKALSNDYGINSGECVDWANREIQKLSQQ